MFIRISTMIQPCDLTDFLNSCVFGKVQLSNLSIMIWQCFWSSMEALVYCTEMFLFIMSLLGNILNFYAFTHQSKFLFKKISLMVIYFSQKCSWNKIFCSFWLCNTKISNCQEKIGKEKKFPPKNGVKKAKIWANVRFAPSLNNIFEHL